MPRLYGSQNLYDKLYSNIRLDKEFTKIDQENKKELLAIRDKERDKASKKMTTTIQMKTASCAEKEAYYSDMLKSSSGYTSNFQLAQLGLDKDLYNCTRIKAGTENN